jgi:hypothetical protein
MKLRCSDRAAIIGSVSSTTPDFISRMAGDPSLESTDDKPLKDIGHLRQVILGLGGFTLVASAVVLVLPHRKVVAALRTEQLSFVEIIKNSYCVRDCFYLHYDGHPLQFLLTTLRPHSHVS